MSWSEYLAVGLKTFWDGTVLPSTDQALQGWDLVDWDTSYEDVARIYADSVDSEGSLVISGGEYEARQWSITFGFDSTRQLSSVTLSFEGAQGKADFRQISRQVIRRLGMPGETTANTSVWTKGGNEFAASKSPAGGLVLSTTV